MKNILILGKGYVGTHVSSTLQGHGHKVLNVSRDLLDYHRSGILKACIKNKRIDVVINCSGYTGFPNVDACENLENQTMCQQLNAHIPFLIENEVDQTDARFIHVGSGCIYTGYDKQYTEQDEPNFGLNNPQSSFYSQTKHLAEKLLDTNKTCILRIRMPIDSLPHHKNYLCKLLKYDNLIDYVNSKTDLTMLGDLMSVIVNNFEPGIFNVVHDEPLSTGEVLDIMRMYSLVNENWSMVPIEKLSLAANRSNCVLNNNKIKNIYGFEPGPERYYMRLCCSIMTRSLKY